MKLIHTICLALVLTVAGTGMKIQAQDGTGYFLHTVTKGQGLYSIASMYNVSIEDIIRLNPGSGEMIRIGQKLKIPQIQNGENGKEQFHTIQAGETLYQLTIKYNISAQAICDANPGLSANNFRIGQVIVIPSAGTSGPSAQASSVSATSAQTGNGEKKQDWKEMHKVQRRETIFSISQMYGITQEELIAANPELKNGKLKRGTFLFIPYPKSEQEQHPASTPSNEELFSSSTTGKKKIGTIKAALMLPFSSNSEEKVRMTEFYEGFLLAVDKLKREGVSMDIYTFDTQGTAAGVKSILSRNDLKEMDLIIGPVHQEGIPVLADFAKKNNVRLVIPFSPKVQEVFQNPNIYQINTPQSYFYSEVYEHFIRQFSNANIIFLDCNNGDNDKAEFIKGLKAILKDNKIPFTQLKVEQTTTPDKILPSMSASRPNIFIPISGRSTALTKLVPPLTSVHRENQEYEMHLFGYPEWQTYTQDFLANFYELDTYFYSSFYTNNFFPAAIDFTKSYRRWYSKDMANTFPKYGMLGYDIGYFFLKGLATQGNKLEDNLERVKVTPIQHGFKFDRVNNWGGFINRKVFFVHFTRDFELIKLDFD